MMHHGDGHEYKRDHAERSCTSHTFALLMRSEAFVHFSSSSHFRFINMHGSMEKFSHSEYCGHIITKEQLQLMLSIEFWVLSCGCVLLSRKTSKTKDRSPCPPHIVNTVKDCV